ncbi:MAG: hypothetical protein Q7R43_04140 [Candidatus Daviesbacteria bacterium]|nr:hypothetical protein [Candidatus Daviesbacteria bacterium]
MKRYQVYLNPYSVSIIDDLGTQTDISRSKLIQGVIDRFADQIAKVFSKRENQPSNYHHFDKLVGAIHLKTKKTTNFAQDIDEIYLQD